MTKLSMGMYAILFLLLSCSPKTTNSTDSTPVQTTAKSKIQVALCLDTSNSMDGLIDQTKSQLWKMVNELASSRRDGEIPDIELALYEYGNSGLSATVGYVRQVSVLTTDLDLISEKLFELKTNGGDEYCGWTIQSVTDDLEWSKSNNDLKLIIMAGNEPFNQGKVDYKISCKAAISKGIMINTIHCGDYETGVRTFWKDGADLSDGEYMNINQDAKVVHIETPFDTEILELNQRLNDTYIGFGRSGKNRKEMQMEQDVNAASYGEANNVERAVSKSKAAYRNEEWDLVDAMKKDDKVLKDVKTEDLPEAMQAMTKAEQKEYVEKKATEREEIQIKINDLNTKRQAFTAEKQKTDGAALTLDNVMLKAVRKQAEAKRFLIKK
jgi:uncharacterized protein YdaT